MSSLARWCFGHRKLVLVLWLAALVLFLGVDTAAKANFASKFQLPNTPSSEAINVLKADFPAVSGEADHIVVAAHGGTVESPAVEARVSRMLVEVAKLPHVTGVISPFSPAGARQVSADRTVAFATVEFDAVAQSIPKAAVEKVITTAEAAQSPQLEVALGGNAIENALPMQNSNSTAFGVVFALIVLGFAFGALFAALLPLATALVAIGIGYAITGLLTHVLAIPSFASLLGVLIGLGVGVDYALFIITRHRNGLRAGRTIEEAAVNAVNTAGRAVFFAGITVCIALLGQFALGVSFLYGVAVGASITVALTMFAALTLLPAFLGFFGRRVLSRRERRRLDASGPVSEESTGFWLRWAKMTERQPVIRAGASLLAVVVIALPVLTLRLGLTDAGSDPTNTTTRHAYDLLAKGFGPGFNGPFTIVGVLPHPSDEGRFATIVADLRSEHGVVAVTPPVVSPSGKAAVATLYPTTSPQAAATSSLLHHLRNQVFPAATKGTGITVLVGGSTAIGDDFAHVLSSKLLLFVAVVVVLAFLLLMVVFRSLLIPLVASVMNLLSVGAALGVMNAVFEWGWGKSLFGVTRTGPVEVFIPVIMFSILFGLSMDYEVFLVSRMHEEWSRSGDNRRAVTLGQAETGRVITAAALIMILVFLSFVLGGSVIITQFGIGLAAAIVIDAFVVRTFLVPSLMHLIGDRNWWLPGWLDRILPHVAVDVPDAPGAPDPRVPEPVG